MAELLMLEFDGIGEKEYLAVNAELGIDAETGQGDWPAGLVTHLAGFADEGRGYVVEVWESQEDQEKFMPGRLGAAMAAGGISAAPKVTWTPLIGHQTPGL